MVVGWCHLQGLTYLGVATESFLNTALARVGRGEAARGLCRCRRCQKRGGGAVGAAGAGRPRARSQTCRTRSRRGNKSRDIPRDLPGWWELRFDRRLGRGCPAVAVAALDAAFVHADWALASSCPPHLFLLPCPVTDQLGRQRLLRWPSRRRWLAAWRWRVAAAAAAVVKPVGLAPRQRCSADPTSSEPGARGGNGGDHLHPRHSAVVGSQRLASCPRIDSARGLAVRWPWWIRPPGNQAARMRTMP
jgi:hypothetical protein